MNNDITSGLEKITFEAGKQIFADGDSGDVAYIVESGSVEIFRETDGNRIILGVIEPGGLFGEMALLDEKPRMAGAEAIDDATCLVLPRELFQKELAQTDAFMGMVVTSLLTYTRSITDRLVFHYQQLQEQDK